MLSLNGGYFYKLALEPRPVNSDMWQSQIWIIEWDDVHPVELQLCVGGSYIYSSKTGHSLTPTGQTFS